MAAESCGCGCGCVGGLPRCDGRFLDWAWTDGWARRRSDNCSSPWYSIRKPRCQVLLSRCKHPSTAKDDVANSDWAGKMSQGDPPQGTIKRRNPILYTNRQHTYYGLPSSFMCYAKHGGRSSVQSLDNVVVFFTCPGVLKLDPSNSWLADIGISRDSPWHNTRFCAAIQPLQAMKQRHQKHVDSSV